MDAEMEYLTRNLYRKEENAKKMKYIREKTSLTMEHLKKASSLTRKNEYHNFGHAVGVAESAIRIAIAEGCTLEEITLLATAALFHDSGQKGMYHWYDEKRSVRLARKALEASEDTKIMGKNHKKVLSRLERLIYATTFSRRGKSRNRLARIIQDADLSNIGQGIYYWLWSSMGLIDEFNREEDRDEFVTPEIFIYKIQEEFVKHLVFVGKGKVYLSKGAETVLSNPVEDVKKLIALPLAAIEFAYRMKDKDITLEKFTLIIKEFEKAA